MLDRLVDVILKFLGLYRAWTIVTEGTRTVVYTLGRATRVCSHDDGWFWTGFHPIMPLGIERDEDTSIRDDWWPCANQALTTADGKKIHCSGSFRISVAADRVAAWQTTLGDESVAASTGLRQAVSLTVQHHTLAALTDPDELSVVRKEIVDRARKCLGRYGYRIHEFAWLDLVETKTYRFVTGE